MSNKQKLIYISILLLVGFFAGKMGYDYVSKNDLSILNNEIYATIDAKEKFLAMDPVKRVTILSKNITLNPGSYIVGKEVGGSIVYPGEVTFKNLKNKKTTITINDQPIIIDEKNSGNNTMKVILLDGDIITTDGAIDIKYQLFGDTDENK